MLERQRVVLGVERLLIPLVRELLAKTTDQPDAIDFWRSVIGQTNFSPRLAGLLRNEPIPESAAAVGLRASLPLKITSSILSPRRLLALCSPITQVMASATLLLPQPFGPTIAVTPRSNASSERSENDLKPLISRRSRRMYTPRRRARREVERCG